jgi:uncharacterized protein (DUF433 family)
MGQVRPGWWISRRSSSFNQGARRQPCFVGTRIAVYHVLEYLASGMTHDEIIADFPELREAHIRAALTFAAMREHRLAAPA